MKPVKLVGQVAIKRGSLNIHGDLIINGQLEFKDEKRRTLPLPGGPGSDITISQETLSSGKCQMITATQSDHIECDYEVNYTHIGPLTSLTVDILPGTKGMNTGNAFPATDGWVFYRFIPPVPGVFPTDLLRTVVVPRMSDFMLFADPEFADSDTWTGTFHPEQAVSLSHHSSGEWFPTNGTWQIVKRIKFPVPSV